MAHSSTPLSRLKHVSSSAFITPPSSTEKEPLPPHPPLPPLLSPSFPSMPHSFLTPTESPKRSPAERPLYDAPKLCVLEGEDALSGLYMGGYLLLTQDILHYLEPSDLCICMSVCTRWNHIISSFNPLLTKVQKHRKAKKRDFENRDNKHVHYLPLLPPNRVPLKDARNRLPPPPLPLPSRTLPLSSTPTQRFPPPTSLPRRVMYKHRPCPQCKAPAKQLNYRRAECTKCQFDYCSACLKAWHDKDCERPKSPKRQTQESSAGTKRSKKNLKRL